MELLAKNVREAREALNLSQQELADLVGLTSITISNIERGQTWPKAPTFDLLAEKLHIPRYVLLLDKEHDELAPKSILVSKLNYLIKDMQNYQQDLVDGKLSEHLNNSYSIKHPIKSNKK